MDPVLSNSQATLIDLLCVENKYINQERLMDNAGMLSAQFFIEKIKNPFNKKVLVIAGKGNNGGDAIIMHHYLLHYGVDSKLFILESADEGLVQRYKISNKFRVGEINKETIFDYDWIVDGIFGIGLNRKITGRYKEIVEILKGREIISLDIPSGLNCDTGEPVSPSIFVEPKYVLCMGFYKYGNLVNQSKQIFNSTQVLDIGFPKISKLISNIKTYLITRKDVKDIVIRDDFLRHKYKGLCSMIVGSKEYSGAGILSLLGSLKTGASYARVAVPGKTVNLYSSVAEAVSFPIGSNDYFIKSNYSAILKSGFLSNEKPILIGPGLGAKKQTNQLTSKILDYLKDKNNNCVLDASGFEPLYYGKSIDDLPKNCILTPHLGEFIKIFPDFDFTNPLEIYEKILKKLNNRVLVLKGPSTFIFSTTGKVYIINNGSSLLATAGSGDVLSGMILGLLAKGYGLDEAAILGVYVQGLTSQRYSERYSGHSMLATDIIENLRSSFNEIYA
tara:strand:+ start:371 stop:1879 length:1509 start_codon:yes stop_codon:yes gene_type:complete